MLTFVKNIIGTVLTFGMVLCFIPVCMLLAAVVTLRVWWRIVREHWRTEGEQA